MSDISRRQALVGVVGGLTVTLTSETEIGAQRGGTALSVAMTTDEIAHLHAAVLDNVIGALGSKTYVTQEGFVQILALTAGIFSAEDRKLLETLGTIVFNPRGTLDAMRDAIGKLVEAAKNSPVVHAVLVIAQDSLTSARRRLADPATIRVAAIVAADVLGALSGIALAAKVGGHPLLLTLGAAAGALTGSVKAWDEVRPKTPAA